MVNEEHNYENVIVNVQIDDLATNEHIFVKNSVGVEFRSFHENPPVDDLKCFYSSLSHMVQIPIPIYAMLLLTIFKISTLL